MFASVGPVEVGENPGVYEASLVLPAAPLGETGLGEVSAVAFVDPSRLESDLGMATLRDWIQRGLPPSFNST